MLERRPFSGSHRLDARETAIILNKTSMSQRVLDDFAILTQS
ncbi:hypothetical protein ABC974_20640 [Sphingomonas oligophenolica]|uniref:Uncharacterized protein n=1 Tax=Sphingomonas oligophenolica TaxID=301154 RepID=A0ABU9Y8B9_9SPHN